MRRSQEGTHYNSFAHSPGEVERVHEAEATRAGETTRGDVDGEELGEVVLGAHLSRDAWRCGSRQGRNEGTRVNEAKAKVSRDPDVHVSFWCFGDS